MGGQRVDEPIVGIAETAGQAGAATCGVHVLVGEEPRARVQGSQIHSISAPWACESAFYGE
jgi:hypothetical protein